MKSFERKVFLAVTTSFFISMINAYPLLGIDKKQENLFHLPGFMPPAWVHEGPLYELYVRNFSSEGTFKEVEKKLSYLKETGIKTIWLMPVYPIGEKGKKGTLGCPYSVRDYFNTNPEYGTLDELKSLINAVHEQDMKIIVDMVANHVSNDYVEMSAHPEMFFRDKHGNFSREVADWTDITDLDYGKQITREHMNKVLKFWIEEIGFDGYRCDVAGMVPLDFWEPAVKELREINPNIYMLAEWESNKHHVVAFHSTYDWTLYRLLKEIKASKKPASDALKWVEEKRGHYPKNALPMRFIENHDEERAAKIFGKEGQKPFAALIFSIYGVPLIYAGQEFGETEKPSLFDKSELSWNIQNNQLLSFYKTLITLRKKYPALASRELIIINNNQPEKVLSYVKNDERHKILCMINTSNKKQNLTLTISAYSINGKHLNLLDNSPVIVKQNSVELLPYQSVFISL
ncbi:MAG: hypothetical protein JXR46_05450 [Calditrichaceae bacterium]|nr:hypothetical protein [Calditrichaceae bacterium]MBN2708471.1 hypothetical protein [Calditrichaceae bacterium]RQV93084.1 MAG: hypothetical protein EH224_13545 [Calditrichota bacterium]